MEVFIFVSKSFTFLRSMGSIAVVLAAYELLDQMRWNWDVEETKGKQKKKSEAVLSMTQSEWTIERCPLMSRWFPFSFIMWHLPFLWSGENLGQCRSLLPHPRFKIKPEKTTHLLLMTHMQTHTHSLTNVVHWTRSFVYMCGCVLLEPFGSVVLLYEYRDFPILSLCVQL